MEMYTVLMTILYLLGFKGTIKKGKKTVPVELHMFLGKDRKEADMVLLIDGKIIPKEKTGALLVDIQVDEKTNIGKLILVYTLTNEKLIIDLGNVKPELDLLEKILLDPFNKVAIASRLFGTGKPLR